MWRVATLFRPQTSWYVAVNCLLLYGQLALTAVGVWFCQATMLDILGLDSYEQRPLDGMSLLPILRGDITDRPIANGTQLYLAIRFCIASFLL